MRVTKSEVRIKKERDFSRSIHLQAGKQAGKVKSAPRASHSLAGFLCINKEKALKQKRSKPFLVAQKEGFELKASIPIELF